MNARTEVLLGAVAAALLAGCSPGAATPAPLLAVSPLATQVAATAAPFAAGDTARLAMFPSANQLVIKNADLEILVEDTDLALDQVTQLAADFGGYIISSETWYAAEAKHGSLRLAIPAAQFEAVINRLRHLGLKLLRETTTGQDVSAEYSDLQTRLTNLEVTAARVRTFLDAAVTVEEALEVNARLSDLEGQIERVKGQMRYYEGRAAMSTVALTFRPELVEPEPPTLPNWDPRATFARAGRVLINFWQAVLDAAIWAGVLGAPVLIGLAAVLGLARLAARRPR